MNSKKIEYNENTMALINELSLINPSMIMKSEDDVITIKASSTDKAVAYVFTCPADHFGFDGEEIAYYNFSEFYKLFSVMDAPSIKQAGPDLTMAKDRSTIKYRLSKSDVIPQPFNKVSFSDPDVVIRLTSEYIKKLYTFVSSNMLGANRLRLKVEGNEITLTLVSTKHANNYSEVIELENEVEEGFEFVISTSIFTNLPSNADFDFSIKEAGIVQFKLINESGVSLDLYTGQVISDDEE